MQDSQELHVQQTLRKAPLNFLVNALRDIETAVRGCFRVGQKLSFC